jgi:acyl-CoA hydrolase
MEWKKRLVAPDAVIGRIRPGTRVFLSTGTAEPRTLVKYMMSNRGANLQDLELIQIVSYADAISLVNLQRHKFRLKTFYSGWIADDAITAGEVDLIPCPLARVPALIESGKVGVDVAFVQITPPDKDGYCSLGIAVDVARLAIEKSNWSAGEVNESIPRTFGDTFIHISEFDLLLLAEDPPVYFPEWTVTPVLDLIADKIAQLIDDSSCVAFSIGPLFVALSSKLANKRNLGIHSPFFSDALMNLVKSGAVSNRNKELFRGKCLTSYACGTAELLAWLNENPTVEFQPVDKVFDPIYIGRNPNFVAVISAKKVDLTGRIELPIGRGNVASGPAEVFAFIQGAQISSAGFTIFGLPSRDAQSDANIVFSIGELKNRIDIREAVDFVVTEFGVANLRGLTLRERAQAMIEIAHPGDRARLIAQAKQGKILYSDQIYLALGAGSAPPEICEKQVFKGLEICFRPIKPSDEEGMRRLFYRFSDEAVYYRYFAPIRAMLHREPRTAPEYIYPVDEWRIIEKRFAPRYLEQSETIFTLANGYMGIRGAFEEGRPAFQNGTFINGFHETTPIVYAETAYGFAETAQTMLNVADAKLLRLFVDDEPFITEHANLLHFERVLDMRHGRLERSICGRRRPANVSKSVRRAWCRLNTGTWPRWIMRSSSTTPRPRWS